MKINLIAPLTLLVAFTVSDALSVSVTPECRTVMGFIREDAAATRINLNHSVFQVLSGKQALGTATFVDEQGYLITARHIFEGRDSLEAHLSKASKARSELKVAFRDLATNAYYKLPAIVIGSDIESDIAVLKIDVHAARKKIDHFAPLVVPLRYRFESQTRAVVIGYKNGEGVPTYADGAFNTLMVSSPEQNRLIAVSPAFDGYSGAMAISDLGGFATFSGRFVASSSSPTSVEFQHEQERAKTFVPLSNSIKFLLSLDVPEAQQFLGGLADQSDLRASALIKLIRDNPIVALQVLYRMPKYYAERGWELPHKDLILNNVSCILPPQQVITLITDFNKHASKALRDRSNKLAFEAILRSAETYLQDKLIPADNAAAVSDSYTSYLVQYVIPYSEFEELDVARVREQVASAQLVAQESLAQRELFLRAQQALEAAAPDSQPVPVWYRPNMIRSNTHKPLRHGIK